MKKKISVIIPAYNECERISQVLNVVVNHPLVNEVIVVNDASTDDTRNVVKKFHINLLNNKKNLGKTLSVKKGIAYSKNDIIVLLDADLVNLKNEDLNNLIIPILQEEADISLTIRKNAFPLFRLINFDFITGERAFNKKLLTNLDLLDNLPGFGLEAHINRLVIEKSLKIKVIKWKNVSHTFKTKKIGFFNSIPKDISMILQIIKVTGVLGFFTQIYKLKKLII